MRADEKPAEVLTLEKDRFPTDPAGRYILKLYVTGLTTRSARAIT